MYYYFIYINISIWVFIQKTFPIIAKTTMKNRKHEGEIIGWCTSNSYTCDLLMVLLLDKTLFYGILIYKLRKVRGFIQGRQYDKVKYRVPMA